MSTTKFTVIIPARYGSVRLAAKLLLPLDGKPVIQHTYEKALKSGAARIIIATDDERVSSVVKAFGAEFCMTNPEHPSGSARLSEAAERCGLKEDDIVVNLQGDEPLMATENVRVVADDLIQFPKADISTLCTPLDINERNLSSVVKVVRTKENFALYFSRALIPFDFRKEAPEDNALQQWQRHLGLYAYRVGFLKRYVNMPVSPLEQLESLEQLRALWHGASIHVADAPYASPPGLDTQEDWVRLQNLLHSSA